MKRNLSLPEYYQKKINTEFQTITFNSKNITSLMLRLKNKGGRTKGRIVCPRRGDYQKRIYRFIDFKRCICPNDLGIVLTSQYDPNRSAHISLICYPIGLFTYILKPTKLQDGHMLINLCSKPVYYGDATSLANFPSGVLIHNISGKFTRSAGCSTILIRKDADQALVKLKSGELRFFNISTIATLGTVSNENHFLRDYEKAGVIRHLGKRPRTRPSSMNPVDHPMGGRTRGGCQPKNKKGIITLNRSTKRNYHPSILFTKRQLKLSKQ